MRDLALLVVTRQESCTNQPAPTHLPELMVFIINKGLPCDFWCFDDNNIYMYMYRYIYILSIHLLRFYSLVIWDCLVIFNSPFV